MRQILKITLWVSLLSCLMLSQATAAEFSLPTKIPTVLGQWHRIIIRSGDSIGRLAKRYDVSMHNIMLHNPSLHVEKYLQPGQPLIMPSCYFLPQRVAPGEIVINLATQTLFFHPIDGKKLLVFPVTVGKPANPTPVGEFYITKKRENPIWYPTESIRASYAKKGKQLPFAVEGGVGNPLGPYAMYLDKPTYLIHTASTIKGLGGQQSFGCVRMYEKDISKLYQQVPVKTKVIIVDQPVPDEDVMYNNCAKAA